MLKGIIIYEISLVRFTLDLPSRYNPLDVINVEKNNENAINTPDLVPSINPNIIERKMGDKQISFNQSFLPTFSNKKPARMHEG